MREKWSFRERWLYAGAAWAESSGRYDKALARIEELEALQPLDLAKQAFKAMLLLRNGEPERSHDLFLKVREEAKNLSDPKHQYIRHYAQAWLAHIRSDPFSTRREERKAAEIDCHPRLKRLLWLPSPDRPDPLDQEFDAWMKANAPTEDDLRKRRR
jgi:hypothetical protein